MKILPLAHIALTACLLIGLGCSRPTPVGSELLDEDRADVRFVDTLQLIAKTIAEDSVQTYDPDITNQLSNYLCGDFQDPIFGPVQAGCYIQFRLSSTSVPDFEGAVLDSVLLNLAYDSTTFYGNEEALQSVEIYEVIETMDTDEPYFSSDSFVIVEEVLGAVYDFVPKPKDNVSIINLSGDTVSLIPQLRIPLDTTFGKELLELDTTFFESGDNFVQHLQGFYVRAARESDGMMGFRLPTTSTNLTLYYTVQDTVRRSYSFVVTAESFKGTRYEHDYSNTEIVFDDTAIGDSILYIQGMSGPNIEIEIPYVDTYDDIIVNKAELEITVVDIPGDDPGIFTEPDQILVTEFGDDGELILIQDVVESLAGFRGFAEEEEDGNGGMIRKYRFNLSAHFQDMVDGTADKQLVLRVLVKQESANRTILYGPGHSQFPMKLNLTFTNLE
ncbi:MAG: DUF4270 domain-containing protein [Bacteroidota bacterium]